SAALSQVITSAGGGSTSTNVALASAGAVATASSTYGSGGYPVSAVNNNVRTGAGWGNGGWHAGYLPRLGTDRLQWQQDDRSRRCLRGAGQLPAAGGTQRHHDLHN